MSWGAVTQGGARGLDLLRADELRAGGLEFGPIHRRRFAPWRRIFVAIFVANSSRFGLRYPDEVLARVSSGNPAVSHKGFMRRVADPVDCGDLSPLFPVGDSSPTTSATDRHLRDALEIVRQIPSASLRELCRESVEVLQQRWRQSLSVERPRRWLGT